MKKERYYLDDQGGSQMSVMSEDISPCILLNGGKGHALIVCENGSAKECIAFAQNTREEVRILGDDGNICGCISAERGSHQTTFEAVKKNKKKQNSKKHAEFNDMRWWIFEDERTGTCTATWYKEPPCIVITKRRNKNGK